MLWVLAAGLSFPPPDNLPKIGDEPAPGATVTIDAQAWYFKPSGWISITRGSKPGTATRLQVGDELQSDWEIEPSLDAQIRFWGDHAVGVRFTRISMSGTSVDEDSFIFHGETFDAGRKVRSQTDFLLFDFDYRYTFHPADHVRLTGHLGAEYWDFNARLRTVDGLSPAIDTSRGFSSAFWLAGMDVAWDLNPWLGIQVFGAGGVERPHQYFWEVEAEALFRLSPSVALTLGYQFRSIHFLQSTNRTGLNFQGPLLGAELRF